MKKSIYFLGAILLGIVVTTWYGCKQDSDESCFQEEICEAKSVTACCTDVDGDQVCVFKYNGKEYAEADIDDLYNDLGCPPVGYNPSDLKAAKDAVINRLKALLERARADLL